MKKSTLYFKKEVIRGVLRRRLEALMVPLGLLCLAMTLRAAELGPEELLAMSRKATGIEMIKGRLNDLETNGNFVSPGSSRLGTTSSTGKQPVRTRDSSGKVRIRLLFPDRFRQDLSYTTPEGSVSWVNTTTRDGDEVWLQNSASNPLPAGLHVLVPPAPPVDEAKRKEVRFKHARYLLALLLYVDPSFPINFTHAGVAEAPDGRADVLDGTGPDGFSVRLFLDHTTHIPLMLSYLDAASGKTVELRLGDYERTAGVFFPRLLSFSKEGQVIQELRLEKYVVNGNVTLRDFQKEAK